jgi:hypothetical protein
MNKPIEITLSVFLFLILSGCATRENAISLTGDYLGQPPPGDEPAIFAPGIVSTGAFERDIAMSPDGKEIYLGVAYGQFVTILYTRQNESGVWGEFEVASFASDPRYSCLEPHVSPDNQKLLFLSTRPPGGKEAKPGWFYQNIWAVDRLEDGSWSDPYDVGEPINTENNEYFPSVTRNGTLYFTRSVKGTNKTNIYRAKYRNGRYETPERLPMEINGTGNPYNAHIAPDESYLIASVAGREDAVTPGVPDYYIFFRDQDDRWSEGINLGEKINEPGARASSQYVSPDGKYLFWGASKRQSIEDLPQAYLTFDLLKQKFKEPQNGSSDIYWMKTDFLYVLKAKK